jgi:Ca2+-binding RTX toxin-like protein
LGFIDLGDGNDLGQGGDFSDSFSGGNGDDSILGNGGNDSYNAGITADGDDTFDGGDGIDTYFALNANAAVVIDLDEGLATGASIGTDKLVSVEDASGSNFDDFLTGTDLVNALRGLGGVDNLFGAGGRDSLFGDDGNDILVGGAAGDFLSGGNDNDTFDYNTLTDSGITASTRDQIVDFVQLADEIDLSTLDANRGAKGNQAFKFVAGAFTKAGQVHAVAHGSNTLIEINTDADKAAEMTILLHGAITLNAGDFVL